MIGHSLLGEKVTELLRDAGEEVIVLDTRPADGVDVVGDFLDTEVLAASDARTAQAVILTLDADNATIFAAAVIRNLAPDAVIIAGTSRVEIASRIHRAGADFALSVSQVGGQLLTYHILGQESVSLEVATKLVAASGTSLTGRPLKAFRVREHTGSAWWLQSNAATRS